MPTVQFVPERAYERLPKPTTLICYNAAMEFQNVLDSFQVLKRALEAAKWIWSPEGPGTIFSGQVLARGNDHLVDRDWLDLAIEKGLFESTDGIFSWTLEDKVETATLKGTKHVMWLVDQPNRICHRVVRNADRYGKLLILMRRPR